MTFAVADNPRCICGKHDFGSKTKAKKLAKAKHSEPVRIYRCEDGGIHITNRNKRRNRGNRQRKAKIKQEHRTSRRKTKQKLNQ